MRAWNRIPEPGRKPREGENAMKCTPGKAARDGILYGILLLAVSPVSLAQSASNGNDRPVLLTEAGKPSATPAQIIYRPPRRGAPVRRVGAGTRTTSENATTTTVSVLAPEAVGMTIRAQPTLYWFASSVAEHRVIVTIVDETSIDPLLEVVLPAPTSPGIQALDLAELGIRLHPGRYYEWEVALVDVSGDRSRDIFARGAIERVEMSDDLEARLADRAPMEKARVLAEAGIWYDAMDELSRAIAGSPEAWAFDAERRSLLRQVKLDEVAAYTP